MIVVGIENDEIVSLGGAELAAELGALSADHLLHASDAGIRAMADAGVVATLLPLTAFALKEPYARGREMIDAGCAVALATDLNPGSCFSGSIPLTIALACIYMQMSIEETIIARNSSPLAASPTTRQPSQRSSNSRSPLRKSEWSSTSMILHSIPITLFFYAGASAPRVRELPPAC